MSVSAELSVRLVRPEEYDAVAAITVEAYRDDGLLAADDDYLAELADIAGRVAHGEVWVALEAAGVPLGSLTFCLHGSPLAELARPGEAEFRMLAVAPNARRGGTARTLLDHAIDRARSAGATALVLSSMPTMTAAHRLYRQRGFERMPERDWSPAPDVVLEAFSLRL